MSGNAGIGCIVLAAGRSQRFGSDKRRANLGDGSSMLARALHNIPPSFTNRILVVRPDDEDLVKPFRGNWQVVFAAEATLGMGHSLAAAMPLADGWPGAVIALADMPFVAAATFNSIRDNLAAGRIVVPYWHQQRGNPVGIGADFFRELAGLQGDQGARMLMHRHAAAVFRIDVDDAGVVQDIDTPEALQGRH